ncbi:MAG: HpcH/HpaI aldolase/citrate lyase family protein [Parasphingopyxis sp.]|uniref:HpcH/HpaI aldolase/citrate lyase family protein n=1 Tax=Parasphingopyxis sp. TaxID=1920299 RepID=UPI003FA004FB
MGGLNSILFVPGSRADRFAKAAESGADLICIDLEDAVAPGDKDAAREAAIGSLDTLDPEGVAIRINGLKTAAGLRDLLALRDAETKPRLVFIPMVESAAEPEIASAVLGAGAPGLVPLIETVKGLRAGDGIAAAPGVAAMMFGGGDFSAELGTDLAWEPLLAARGAFVMSAAAARIPAIDVPFIALDDDIGLEAEVRRAKALGFAAKAAIHPKQVETINSVMRPTEEELAEARAALDAYAAAGGKVIRHNGKMLEAPVIRRFEAMLGMDGLGTKGKEHA